MKPIAGPRAEFIEISQAEEGSANRAAFLTPGGGVARPPALSSSPDMTALLMALHRRWKLALASGIACGVLAASAMWYAFPPSKYKAYVMLHVSTMPPKIVFDHDNTTSYSTYQRTQVALIKSRFVLSQAIKDPAIADLETIRTQSDPVDWLEKQIGVDFPGGSEILQINLSGERPGDLARIVNAVADSYLANIVENERRDRLKHYTELKSVYDRYQTILEDKRLALKKLAESVGSNDRQTLAVKQRLALGQLDRRRDELIQVQSDLKRLQVDLAALEAGERERYGEAPHGVVDESMIERDPRVAAFKERIAKDSRRIAELKRTVRAASDPTITAVQREMQANLRALEDYRKALRSLQIEKGQKERRAVVAETRERVTTLMQYEEAIVKELELLMEKDDSFNKETLDLQTKEEQIALTSETARKVGTLMESIEVEVHAPPRIRMLDRAEVPRTKDDKKKFKATGAAGLGTMACVVLGISLYEFRSRRVGSAGEVVNGLGMRLVGTLPSVSSRSTTGPSPRTRREKDRRSILTESINATRTVLLHASRVHSFNVVMITSASKGEGKTTLSSQLSTSLALAGLRTIVVDCDLRSPSLHRVFDMSSTPGIAEYLRGGSGKGEIIHPTAIPNHSMIPAGVADEGLIQAFAQGEIKTLLASLKREFDIVIVDSPPVLPVADSLLLSQYVDVVLFAILRGVSRVPKVFAAYEKLSMLGTRILGAVMIGAEMHERTYS